MAKLQLRLLTPLRLLSLLSLLGLLGLLAYKLTSMVEHAHVVRLSRLRRPSRLSRRSYSVTDRVEPRNGHRQAAARDSLAEQHIYGGPRTRRPVADRADVGVHLWKCGEFVWIAAGEDDDRRSLRRHQPLNQPVLGRIREIESRQRELLSHDDEGARPGQPAGVSLPFPVAQGKIQGVRTAPADLSRGHLRGTLDHIGPDAASGGYAMVSFLISRGEHHKTLGTLSVQRDDAAAILDQDHRIGGHPALDFAVRRRAHRLHRSRGTSDRPVGP